MESPVVLEKPPEYYGNDRGFPFEEEEGSGAWSELAARHPDIAARLRQRPATATWARKRRPSSQDATDDFGENFGGFDRFPFDDIPPEFREHFPSHWNRSRRFGSREEAPPQPQPQASPPPPPQQAAAATQTEEAAPPPGGEPAPQSPLPQYGLRNTVDLGQRSPADPSLVDAEERSHRSMSAPPDRRPPPDMSTHHPAPSAPPQEPSNVRHIPIFVEGRDEPVINRSEPPPPPPPHVDRDQYFADEGPATFHHPTNFTRAFGAPFAKGYRQGPQPFTQQKAYPQSASFARAASPPRPQSPRPAEPFVKVPVHHEHAEPHPRQPSPHQRQPSPPQPQREPSPPQAPPKPAANDPISVILGIQTDVLNLMTEVENFTGTKRDKRYLFLDEMLTRNLIKLDNIETDGKENIRLARKEAIRCIQKCIAVLEAKAEKGSSESQTQDVEMKDNAENTEAATAANGEAEMKETQPTEPLIQEDLKPETKPQEPQKPQEESAPAADPEQLKPSEDKDKTEQVESKTSPKKKIVKNRDSSDKAPAASAEAAKDSNKEQVTQVDSKGEADQVMETDGAASQ